MANIKDIAEMAQVSSATVSRVINNEQNVKQETRVKVIEAMKKLNYIPNRIARDMKVKKTNSIGLILADIINPFYAETAKRIVEVANENNYSVFLFNTNDNINQQEKYIDILLQRQVDGFIFASAYWEENYFENIVSKGIPFVLYNRTPYNFDNYNYVVADNRKGANMMVEHLYNLGHERIALISGPDIYSTARDKAAGYFEAIKKLGLSYRRRLIMTGPKLDKCAYDATIKLLASSPPPTAIFAANDSMALSVLEAVKRQGLKIAEDIAVVGFNNIEIAGHNLINLTTMDQNKRVMAEIAINNLIGIISNNSSHDKIQVTVEPQLVVRKTCGSIS